MKIQISTYEEIIAWANQQEKRCLDDNAHMILYELQEYCKTRISTVLDEQREFERRVTEEFARLTPEEKRSRDEEFRAWDGLEDKKSEQDR